MEEKHFTLHRIGEEFREVLLGERGFLFTVRRMAFSPRASLLTILGGHKSRFNEPVKFVVLCIALAVVGMNLGLQLGGTNSVPELAEAIEAKDKLQDYVESLNQLAMDDQSTSEVKFRASNAVAALERSQFEGFQDTYMQWSNVALLAAVPFFALGTLVFFRSDLNLAEHFVVNAYIYGM